MPDPNKLTPREVEILRLVVAGYERKYNDDDDLDTIINPQELSDREKEILVLLASGRDRLEIAVECEISYHTVRSHLIHIFQKLNARNGRHAVAVALRLKLITIDQIDL